MTLLTGRCPLQIGQVVKHSHTGLHWLVVGYCCKDHPITIAREGIEADVPVSELEVMKQPRDWKARHREQPDRS